MSAEPAPAHLTGWTAAEVRAAEAPLLAAGVPLMRRAATGLAAAIRDVLRLHGRSVEQGPILLVLAGSGDNGGDALFAAAELAEQGAVVRVLATGSRIHEEGAEAARAAGARWVDDDAQLGALVTVTDVIVDGILGIGTNSPALRGRAREVVARIRDILGVEIPSTDARPPRPAIVAVDLPSGVDADDGSVPDATVLPADVTVTFGAVKAGLLRAPGKYVAGEVRLVELGLTRQDSAQ